MQPKLLKTQFGEFELAAWSGKNDSGMRPISDRVLVLPDQASEKTSGGIFLDEDTIEKMSMASETGVLVELGSEAFLWNSDRRRRWEGDRPHPGQRVCFERYSGSFHRGRDGKSYRLMDDTCIGAIEDDRDVAAQAAVEGSAEAA